MAKVYLGLGSNLGETQSNLMYAIQEIEKRIGKIESQSTFFLNEPWGFHSEHLFCNAVVCVECDVEPIELLHLTQEIEKTMGRSQKSVANEYFDRIIDIDLIAIDDSKLATDVLTLPHPLMHQRDFVLVPMCEIAPDWVHPLLSKNIRELIRELHSHEA